MSHIVIIDEVVGNPRGFCVRVGTSVPNRLANCLAHNNGNGPIGVYATFQEAYVDAIRFRDSTYPSWTVRADCTL